MTDLLSRPRAGTGDQPGPRSPRLGRLGERLTGGPGRLRPLTVSAALAAVAAAGSTLLTCMAVAVVGWFLADAGGHGETTDALRVGADVWLVGHGSGISLRGVPLTVVPLGLTALLVAVGFRLARWAGTSSEPEDDDRQVGLAALIHTGCYLVFAVVTCVLAADAVAAPGIGRTILGAVLLAGSSGTLGLAVGTGRLRGWVDRVPGWVRAVVTGSAVTFLVLVLAAALLVAGALLAGLNEAAAVLSGLRLDVGDHLMYAGALALVAPNAVLLGVAYLLGPGFAVGTGTVVSPTAVVLGPVPAFPLFAALPDAGPTSPWLAGLLAVPVFAGIVGAVLAQRSYGITAYDSAALRGFGSGLGAALLSTVAVALAGGPMGTGRMADLGASTAEVLVAAVMLLSSAGLVAGLATAWWQRRRGIGVPPPDGPPVPAKHRRLG